MDNFKWDSDYPGCAKIDPSATCHGCQSESPLPFRSGDITGDSVTTDLCSNAWLFLYLIPHYVSHTLTKLSSLTELQDRTQSSCLWYHSSPAPSPLLGHKWWQTRWQTSSNPFLVQVWHFGLKSSGSLFQIMKITTEIRCGGLIHHNSDLSQSPAIF